MDKFPDITKFGWQLNTALAAAVFATFALVYNEKYIYYGLVTFLFGIVSTCFGQYFNFMDEKYKTKLNKNYFLSLQLVLIGFWVAILIKIY